LFLVVVAILVLLVVAMLVHSTGSPEQTEILATLLQTLVGVGVLVLSVRLLRNIAGRR
jgi:hypothetical protein